jgi:hypothetical protein
MTDNYIHAVEPGLGNEHFRIYDIPRVRLPRGFIPAEILLEELIMPDIGTIESLSGDFVYWMKREENRSNYSYALRHAIELYEFVNRATREGYTRYEFVDTSGGRGYTRFEVQSFKQAAVAYSVKSIDIKA